MSDTTLKQRLAAILAADVAGYSHLAARPNFGSSIASRAAQEESRHPKDSTP